MTLKELLKYVQPGQKIKLRSLGWDGDGYEIDCVVGFKLGEGHVLIGADVPENYLDLELDDSDEAIRAINDKLIIGLYNYAE